MNNRFVTLCFIYFIMFISCDNEINPLSNNKKSICLYGDSTFDPGYLYNFLRDSLGFSKVFNRCVPGCGYVNGYVNRVYWFVEKADTAFRLRYGDPVNNPSIEKDNLPEGCWEIDAHNNSDDRINTIPSNCDIVLIGGGLMILAS